MILRPIFNCQAVHVLLLLSTAATAVIIPGEAPSQPVSSAGAAESPAPGSPLGGATYQGGQPRNVYTYPMGKQYTTYTYTGSPSSQYGSASSDGGNTGNGYSAIPYQNGAHQYVNSYNGPYSYYIAHPGEASSGGAPYQPTRSEAEEGLQFDGDNSYPDVPPNGVKAINRAVNPDETIIGSAKRSLLDILGQPEVTQTVSQPMNSLTSAIPGFLDQAKVQLSFSGGYPSNSPRYTYLTFIIPGDLCTLNQQEVAGSGSISTSKGLGTLGVNGFISQPVAYGSTYSTSYTAPGSLASGYDASGHYQYGSSVQSHTAYSNGPTIGMFAPMQVGSQPFAGGLNGGVVSGANSLFKPAVRSLDDHAQNNPVDSKSPPTPAPASGNAKPNEEFASGTRSVSK